MSLQSWDLLADIPEDGRRAVLDLGASRALPAGTVVFGLGDEASELFLVVTGKVNLTLPVHLEGKHLDATVEERLPGQLLGWSGLVPPHRYTLRAVATEETELLALPRAALLDLFAARPELGYAVLSNVAAVIGRRLQIFQTMWIREMQRVIETRKR